jgi:RNA polymerase sigma-70 factor (ECF subfamily)
LRAGLVDIHKVVIEDCLRGDEHARRRLYDLYAKAIYNVCCRLTGNLHDAEDVLQDTFVIAFLKLDTFRFESSFGAWLKRIAINTSLNFLKKRRESLVFESDIQKYKLIEEEEYPAGLSIEKILAAMEKLPSAARIVFSLYLMEGYDHQEIAGILNISESTSKSQYMRARRRMQEILSENKNQ